MMTESNTNQTGITDQAFGSSIQVKAKCLQEEIDRALKHTRQQRRKNQKRASAIKLATLLFSAAATILLGLQFSRFEGYFKQIAFVLGAVVTLLNALEPYFNFRALWIEHEQALADFYQIKDDLSFYLGGVKPEDIDAEVLNKFHSQYQATWQQLSKAWIGYRKTDRVQIERGL